MTERKVAMTGMSVREFEMLVPETAEIKRMRIEQEKVCFALGYDRKQTVAVMWNSRGRAFVRPLSRNPEEFVKFKGGMATRFNGWVYYRCKDYDLIGKRSDV